MGIHRLIMAIFGIMLLSACTNGKEKVIVDSVNGSWNQKSAQSFNFEIDDAQIPKNIIFVVRNNEDYPYSNLRLIASIINSKTKQKQTDTLNYILAKPNGEWLGTGFGTVKEALFQYKLNYRFPENGKYTISVLQAMREKNLKGIEDIGIKIQPAKP